MTILTTQPLKGFELTSDWWRNEMYRRTRDEYMRNVTPGTLLINVYNLKLYVVVSVKKREPLYRLSGIKNWTSKLESDVWHFSLFCGDNVIRVSSTMRQSMDAHGFRVVGAREECT